jgi:hypothetical protein
MQEKRAVIDRAYRRHAVHEWPGICTAWTNAGLFMIWQISTVGIASAAERRKNLATALNSEH